MWNIKYRYSSCLSVIPLFFVDSIERERERERDVSFDLHERKKTSLNFTQNCKRKRDTPLVFDHYEQEKEKLMMKKKMSNRRCCLVQ